MIQFSGQETSFYDKEEPVIDSVENPISNKTEVSKNVKKSGSSGKKSKVLQLFIVYFIFKNHFFLINL